MRDADTKGGSLQSGTSHKEKITGGPDKGTVMKPSQKPPSESDHAVGRGQKIRSNSRGY